MGSITQTQTCWDCEKPKLMSEFGLWKRKKSGYNTICKLCMAKRTRKIQISRREYTDEIKLKSGCADCGYKTHAQALTFDHLPGFVKIENVSKMVSRNAKVSVIDAEIAKCEIVCANCHAVRTANRRKGETHE